MTTSAGPLGRVEPTDWQHVERYPFSAVAQNPPARAERILDLPETMISHYNQGSEGACVGFAGSWLMSILNRKRYDARRLWNEAKAIDEWSWTLPGDNNGTSVRAAMDVLRKQGHWPWRRGVGTVAPVTGEGIEENRWAVSIDEMRTAIQRRGTPVEIGVNWYTAFDNPRLEGKGARREYWVGRDGNLGSIRGGHAVCVWGVSDERQAFCFVNSWGPAYPRKVWLPFSVMERLLNENGEATLITDRA